MSETYIEKSSYERYGLGALFAFTPFKIVYTTPILQSTESSGAIVFWYPKGMTGFFIENMNEKLFSESLIELIKKKECKKLDKLWRVPLKCIVRDKVHIYTTFPAIMFSPGNDKYVLIINRRLYKYLIGENTENEAKEAIKKAYMGSTFVLAEFSYRSIDRPNICKLGLVLITHRKICPLINLCPYKRPHNLSISCNHFLNWERTKETYAGLYKVTAELGIEVTEFESQKLKIVKSLLTIPYKSKPFIEITFIDPVNVLAYYRGVNFIPKKKYVDRLLEARFGKTLGVRLYLTSALKVRFINDVLNEVLNDILSDENIRKWLQFKARLLILSEFINSSKRLSLEPWIRINKIICKSYKSNDEFIRITHSLITSCKQDDMDKAMKFIIVHTIAHIIMLGLWSLLGLSEDELGYIITYDGDNFEIQIFEATSGGYGYLRYLVENRDKLYKLLTSIFSNIDIKKCVSTIDDGVIKGIEKLIDDVENELKGKTKNIDIIENICRKLKEFLRRIEELYEYYNVTPHVYTIHECITTIVPGQLREYFSKVIDKFYTIFQQFDGVIGYYYLENGCMMGPFLQPFSTSCSIAEILAKGINEIRIKGQLRTPIIMWLRRAKSSIDISTYVLSIHDFEVLLNLLRKACKNNVKIRILLGEGAINDENSMKSVEKLYKDFDKCIEIRLYTEAKLHKKVIIIDDIALIDGSFNLTRSALTSNIESARISIDPIDIEKEHEEFNSLWSKAKLIRTPDDLKS